MSAVLAHAKPDERISVTPVSGAVGAEIKGIDLSRPIRDDDVRAIGSALYTHGVVFFRDQTLTPDGQLSLAERFGPINVNRFFAHVPGHPDVAEVRKESQQKSNIGGGWHTDHSYDQEPALGSILYALEVPETGGDTLFASMYAAYDALSDGLKNTLKGLRACHSSRHVFGSVGRRQRGGDTQDRILNPELATQDAVHPVVIRHPGSGRPALYVNPGFTLRFDGWTEEESKPLLEYLYRHASRPEFSCRFHWQPGSLAFWDNRATWHYAANDYHGHRRLMHRVTIDGSDLAPAV